MLFFTTGSWSSLRTRSMPSMTSPTTRCVLSRSGTAPVVMANPVPFGTMPERSTTSTSLPLSATSLVVSCLQAAAECAHRIVVVFRSTT